MLILIIPSTKNLTVKLGQTSKINCNTILIIFICLILFLSSIYRMNTWLLDLSIDIMEAPNLFCVKFSLVSHGCCLCSCRSVIVYRPGNSGTLLSPNVLSLNVVFDYREEEKGEYRTGD